ncbi:MAG: S46 family peptidase [Candidatus Aminicenantes bacterium]|nr:S46 family peptidase [Candidatus Aminicenantes bacterium]
MTTFAKRFALAVLVLALAFMAGADDGMWMPHQMKDLNLKALGLRMDPGELYKTDGTGLMSAVVNLGGGTGEFVSPEGLVLTNHHVAYGAIQRASSKAKNYIADGFMARTRGEEIPAQGYTVGALLGYEDVTAKVNAFFKPKMTPRQRYDAYDKAQKELVAAGEKAGPDLRCTLASMYSGNAYYLYTFKQIRDVRLVYAPPQDLGNYGGEVDNWMWPRHTCDFSFLRAYVAPDGTAADYSPSNVPYKPKVWLKLSLDGFKEGDFTFVMGYPGRTYRNFSLAELKADQENMAERIEETEALIDFYEAAGKDDKEVEIRYASRLRGLYNGLKNRQGKLEGFVKYDLVAKKAAQEKELLDWIAAEPSRAKMYGGAAAALEAFLARQKAFGARTELLNSVLGGSTILSQASNIVRAVEELQKPDKEREQPYQERNLPRLKQGIELAERGYVCATDRELLKWTIGRLKADHPELEAWPSALKGLVAGSDAEIAARVDAMYAGTVLGDPARRLELLGLKPAQLAALDDPFLDLAADIEKELKVVREESKGLSREGADLKKTYEAAILEMKSGAYAPDANGTIRFTYGPVSGYEPRDAVLYLSQTTVKGVLEKETGEFPFNVPDRIEELWKAKDFGPYEDDELQDVPCCFLNTTNVTGGNSGSPTLNAKGEQIGIIFDMTYESVIGDYYVIPELQRSISVDVRYILWVTDKFSGASHIIRELGLAGR